MGGREGSHSLGDHPPAARSPRAAFEPPSRPLDSQMYDRFGCKILVLEVWEVPTGFGCQTARTALGENSP